MRRLEACYSAKNGHLATASWAQRHFRATAAAADHHCGVRRAGCIRPKNASVGVHLELLDEEGAPLWMARDISTLLDKAQANAGPPTTGSHWHHRGGGVAIGEGSKGTPVGAACPAASGSPGGSPHVGGGGARRRHGSGLAASFSKDPASDDGEGGSGGEGEEAGGRGRVDGGGWSGARMGSVDGSPRRGGARSVRGAHSDAGEDSVEEGISGSEAEEAEELDMDELLARAAAQVWLGVGGLWADGHAGRRSHGTPCWTC